jgi:hypothetical protein
MTDNITPKTAKDYKCDKCEFICSKKSDWDRHINTRKHNNRIKLNILEQKKGVQENNRVYNCKVCNKEYNARNSLWYHEQKCKELVNKNNNNNYVINDENSIIHDLDMKTLIMELVKSNTELQKQTMEMHQQMIEVCKNSNTTINNNNSHSNNKTFNMQVFLNEKCKDAMNIMDFVNSMTLDFSDLEELGELGYVEGISRQLIRKLSEMDVYKRPIHCSDLKRETMYVRDNDVWEKETEPYTNLRKLIKYITKKNGDLMIPWRNAHPQCMNLQHPLNDTYLAIMNQAMGGKGEFAESESKIIRKISKCVTIDKSDY